MLASISRIWSSQFLALKLTSSTWMGDLMPSYVRGICSSSVSSILLFQRIHSEVALYRPTRGLIRTRHPQLVAESSRRTCGALTASYPPFYNHCRPSHPSCMQSRSICRGFCCIRDFRLFRDGAYGARLGSHSCLAPGSRGYQNSRLPYLPATKDGARVECIRRNFESKDASKPCLW